MDDQDKPDHLPITDTILPKSKHGKRRKPTYPKYPFQKIRKKLSKK